jgi:hypothetical protein
MRKRARISLLLSLSLFVLQATGLHLHAHQAAGRADALVVHVALATDHAGKGQQGHDESVELSLPDTGLLKKADSGDDLPDCGVAVDTYAFAIHLPRCEVMLESREATLSPVLFERPHLRAPPTTHAI